MKLFVFAGEMSADLCASRVIPHLKHSLGAFELIGVGGPHLKASGQKQVLTMQAFQTMGFSDVLKRLPTVLKNFYTVRNAIIDENPELVLFIDQPALSIRMAKNLRKNGFKGKIVQFVAPTVWAYNPKRADIMAESFDLLLTLFDFEPKYFSHTSLKTVFVGHPIVEIIESAKQAPKTLSLKKPLLAIFPGSRPDEIQRNLPKQLQAAHLVKKEHPELDIVVSGRDVAFEARYELMRESSLALAKSGTVTLELLLHQVPTVVTYELTLLNRLAAKYLIGIDKMPYYSIANIVSGKEIFPELIRPPVTCQAIAKELSRLYSCPTEIPLPSLQEGDIAPSKRVADEISLLLT